MYRQFVPDTVDTTLRRRAERLGVPVLERPVVAARFREMIGEDEPQSD